MTNVVPIGSNKRTRRTNTNVSELQHDISCAIIDPKYLTEPKVAEHSRMLEDLDSLADDMLIRKLALIHRQEADRRAWTVEEEAMAAEMEAAAYLAFRAGVPEEAIYDLDHEPLSKALSSAIRKVEDIA